MAGERGLGTAAALVGLAAIGLAWGLPDDTLTGGPGTRLLPLILGSLMTVFGGAVALRPAQLAPAAGARGAAVPITVMALLGYALALERLGFIPTTAALLALLLVAYGERRWPVVAAVALGLTVATYLVFATWLKVPLPQGLLGQGLLGA